MTLSQKAKIVLPCLVIPLVMCGCWNKTGNEQSLNDNRISKLFGNGLVAIYRDNETGVQYITGAGSDGGICVMVNADGTPYTGTQKGGDLSQ